MLRSLQDSGAPDLDTTSQFLRTTEPKELSGGDKDSLLRFMGLPLRLFEKVCYQGRCLDASIHMHIFYLGILLSALPSITAD